MQASREWATRPADQRFETLEGLRTAVHSRRLRSRATVIDIREIKPEMNDEGKLILNSAIEPATPNHWSFGQLCGAIHAPAQYLRSLPESLVLANLQHGFAHAERTRNRFMVVSPEDRLSSEPSTLQAVTSETYGRIWDADVVDAVGRIVERSGGKFHNPLAYDLRTGGVKPSGLYASDRDVFMFMIDGGSRLEPGPRAKLNRGFFVWNSEVGRRTMGIMTFLFNEVCGNHIVWGASDIRELRIKHTAGAPVRFDSEVMPLLRQYAESSTSTEEAVIRKAMELALPTENDDLMALAAKFDISRTELNCATRQARIEEGECRTYWNLVQGLTAYARGFEFVDARIDLETRAGKILKSLA